MNIKVLVLTLYQQVTTSISIYRINLFNNFLYGILICSGSRIEMMEVTFMNKKYNIEKVADKVVSFLDCISLNGCVCHCSLLEFDTEVGVL